MAAAEQVADCIALNAQQDLLRFNRQFANGRWIFNTSHEFDFN